jgi:hypothetical protein
MQGFLPVVRGYARTLLPVKPWWQSPGKRMDGGAGLWPVSFLKHLLFCGLLVPMEHGTFGWLSFSLV